MMYSKKHSTRKKLAFCLDFAFAKSTQNPLEATKRRPSFSNPKIVFLLPLMCGLLRLDG